MADDRIMDGVSAAARAAFLEAVGPAGVIAQAADQAAYTADWRGRYTGITPMVLRPSTTVEVQKIVQIAAAHRVALVPQGGNSGLVGGGVPDGSGRMVLVSLDRMTKIRALSPDDSSVVAESGVILSDLHTAAENADRDFPLSLSAKGSARIGGLISTNAGGVQVLRYGCMRNFVLGLEAVLPNGDILHGLSPLRKDNTGYDIKQLLIGAEGTLGIITAATLKLYPRPRQIVTAFAALDTPERALELLSQLRAATGDMISSFELMPRAGLDLVLHFISAAREIFPAQHPWYVLIEATSTAQGDTLAAQMEQGLAAALRQNLVADAAVAQSAAQAQAFWTLRECLPEAERLEGGAIKHDIAVPVADMPPFMRAATREIDAQFPGARVLAFGHLGDGNVHFNVRPPTGADGPAWLAANAEPVSRLVHDWVVQRHGGSISAEHGIGALKRQDHARLADPARLAAQRAIKAALDPQNILNPGRLL